MLSANSHAPSLLNCILKSIKKFFTFFVFCRMIFSVGQILARSSCTLFTSNESSAFILSKLFFKAGKSLPEISAAATPRSKLYVHECPITNAAKRLAGNFLIGKMLYSMINLGTYFYGRHQKHPSNGWQK